MGSTFSIYNDTDHDIYVWDGAFMEALVIPLKILQIGTKIVMPEASGLVGAATSGIASVAAIAQGIVPFKTRPKTSFGLRAWIGILIRSGLVDWVPTDWVPRSG